MSDKDFAIQKPNLINEIYEWVGEVQSNKTYSTIEKLCSAKFELAKLIKTYLNISDFKSFKSKFINSRTNSENTLNKSEFIKSIFTGEAYENKILVDNAL
jgi:hypothetical protein